MSTCTDSVTDCVPESLAVGVAVGGIVAEMDVVLSAEVPVVHAVKLRLVASGVAAQGHG